MSNILLGIKEIARYSLLIFLATLMVLLAVKLPSPISWALFTLYWGVLIFIGWEPVALGLAVTFLATSVQVMRQLPWATT